MKVWVITVIIGLALTLISMSMLGCSHNKEQTMKIYPWNIAYGNDSNHSRFNSSTEITQSINIPRYYKNISNNTNIS